MFFEKSTNSVNSKKAFVYSNNSIDEPDKLLEQFRFGEHCADGQSFKMTFKTPIDLEILRLKFQGPRRNCCTLYDVIIEVYRRDVGSNKNDQSQTLVFKKTFERVPACKNECLLVEIDEPIYIIPNMWYTVKFELIGMEPLVFNKRHCYCLSTGGSIGDTENTSSSSSNSSTSSNELAVDFITTKHLLLALVFRLPNHLKARKKKSFFQIFCFK